jgi:preprotein translocase subunit SecG
MQLVFQILLALVAIFLILLVLVQRGRGGGLAGALGGMGGSSAFGAKAGDIFTRITIVAAAFWIVLCIAAAKFGPSTAGSRLNLGTESHEATTTVGPDLTAPVTGEKASESVPGEPPASQDSAAGDETTGGDNAAEPASSESAPAESKTE